MTHEKQGQVVPAGSQARAGDLGWEPDTVPELALALAGRMAVDLCLWKPVCLCKAGIIAPASWVM